MTFPLNYARVWVRGRFIDLAKAAGDYVHIGLQGEVTFTPSPGVLLDAGTGQIIASASFRATPAARDGYFEIKLPATDDPDINPAGWTYSVKEPSGRTYNMVVPHDTAPLDAPGDPLDGEPVIDLISVVPIPEPNAGMAQVLTGRGVNDISVTDGHLIITFDDQTTQDAGVLPVSALREAIDYDDSVPPGTDQAITYNSAAAKFRPQTVSLPGHTHSGEAITTGVIAFARLPTGTTGTTIAPGDHQHSGADITSGVVAYSRLPVGTTPATVAAGDDSRLSNARTPTTHAPSHATGGTDPLTPGAIGASATGHTHTATDLTAGTVDIARLPTGTTASTVAIGNHTHPLSPPPVVLTDAATITTNASLGSYFRVSIAGNRTLAAPTSPTSGQRATWEITASGATRTITLSTAAGGFDLGPLKLPSTISITSGDWLSLEAVYNDNAWRIVNATSQQLPAAASGSTLIADQAVSAPIASVTFSAIPQTYKHLQIMYFARTSSGGKEVLYLRLNGDTSGSYDTQAVWGDGTGPGSLRRLSITAMEAGAVSPASTGNPAGGEILIPGYYTSGTKVINARSSFYVQGVGIWVWSASGLWWGGSAGPVTSITLYPDNGQQFASGAYLSLYGIK